MNTRRKLSLLLFCLDLAAVLVAFNLVSFYRGLAWRGFLFQQLFWPAALLTFTTYLIDGYRARTDMKTVDYTGLHIIALIFAMLATLLITFVFVPSGYELQSSRIVITLSFLVLIPVTFSYRHLLQLQFIQAHRSRRFLFVGDAESREQFRAECRRMGLKQPVLFSAASEEEAAAGAKPLRAWVDEIRAGQADIEAIVLRESHRDITSDIAQSLAELYFRGVPTYPLELFHQIYWHKVPLYRLNSTWLFQEGFQVAREPIFERLKRISDLVLASLGLILASPLIVIAAAAIWIDDRGPVFFFQTRLGRNQVPFRIAKLRTLRAGADTGDPYTRSDDSRITRVGGLLRKCRLDELPQLWNVVSGEMSLIGPRAEWERLVAEYERKIPCYSYRHLVKPGITGWAQVNYPYGSSLEDATRKLEYDLYYIRHFSFLLDASIVLKTVQIMLLGKGR